MFCGVIDRMNVEGVSHLAGGFDILPVDHVFALYYLSGCGGLWDSWSYQFHWFQFLS